MGAYNVLFHFHKFSKRLGPLVRRFAPDHQPTVSTPTPLFISSTLALIWMGLVLGFITLHEMTPGHKGNLELNAFYSKQLVFGCFVPLIYSFTINAEVWWSRWVVALCFILFAGFYIYLIIQQQWSMVIKVSAVSFLVLSFSGFLYYFLFSKVVNRYYAHLRQSR